MHRGMDRKEGSLPPPTGPASRLVVVSILAWCQDRGPTSVRCLGAPGRDLGFSPPGRRSDLRASGKPNGSSISHCSEAHQPHGTMTRAEFFIAWFLVEGIHLEHTGRWWLRVVALSGQDLEFGAPKLWHLLVLS